MKMQLDEVGNFSEKPFRKLSQIKLPVKDEYLKVTFLWCVSSVDNRVEQIKNTFSIASVT